MTKHVLLCAFLEANKGAGEDARIHNPSKCQFWGQNPRGKGPGKDKVGLLGVRSEPQRSRAERVTSFHPSARAYPKRRVFCSAREHSYSCAHSLMEYFVREMRNYQGFTDRSMISSGYLRTLVCVGQFRRHVIQPAHLNPQPKLFAEILFPVSVALRRRLSKGWENRAQSYFRTQSPKYRLFAWLVGRDLNKGWAPKFLKKGGRCLIFLAFNPRLWAKRASAFAQPSRTPFYLHLEIGRA